MVGARAARSVDARTKRGLAGRRWFRVLATVIITVLVVGTGYYFSQPERRFEFAGDVSQERQDLSVEGRMVGRFVVSASLSSRTDCNVLINATQVYRGTCASFRYEYKTKREAEFKATVTLKVSFHRNETDSAISLTILGEVSGQFNLSGQIRIDNRERTWWPLPQLDVASESSASVERVLRNGTLLQGRSANYTLEVEGELWLNVSASASVLVKVVEETITIVEGDCHSVSVFSLIRRSASLELKTTLRIIITFLPRAGPSATTFELAASGPGLKTVS